MLVLVAGISFLVQVYSVGYMAADPGYSRYFAFQSLFAWAMMFLVLSSSLLQLYVFWELVGLSSYLLIGFWYEKFSASQAGKKAFVMTRVGDVALFMGILLILIHTGGVSYPRPERLGYNVPNVAGSAHPFRPSHLRGNHREKRPVPPPDLASGCHGRSYAGQCSPSLGHNGRCGCLPDGTTLSFPEPCRGGDDRVSD